MLFKEFNNGVKIPMLGYGVFRVGDGTECFDAVKCAIETGYRHIDTAAAYRNEESVGKAIKASGIARGDLFVTTKISNPAQREMDVNEAFTKSLDQLGMDYVDLYIIHWPVKEHYINTWMEMEKIYKSGRAKAIGVSNFQVHHLDELAKSATMLPALNQIEMHPRMTQKPLIKYCFDKGIAPQSWSPLGGSWEEGGMRDSLLENAELAAIGKKYGKSIAQIILRWNMELGIIAIPKSVTPSRMKENLEIFDFELSREDIAAIDALNMDKRIGPDPDNFTH